MPRKRQAKSGLSVRPQLLASDGEAILKAIGSDGSNGRIDPSTLMVEERRAAVAVLFAMGWDITAMARRLKSTPYIVKLDVKHIHSMAAHEYDLVSIKEIAAKFDMRYEHLYRKAMELFDDGKAKLDQKAKALKLAADIQKNQRESLKALGVISSIDDPEVFNQRVQEATRIHVDQLLVMVDRYVPEDDRLRMAEEVQQQFGSMKLIDGEVDRG